MCMLAGHAASSLPMVRGPPCMATSSLHRLHIPSAFGSVCSSQNRQDAQAGYGYPNGPCGRGALHTAGAQTAPGSRYQHACANCESCCKPVAPHAHVWTEHAPAIALHCHDLRCMQPLCNLTLVRCRRLRSTLPRWMPLMALSPSPATPKSLVSKARTLAGASALYPGAVCNVDRARVCLLKQSTLCAMPWGVLDFGTLQALVSVRRDDGKEPF